MRRHLPLVLATLPALGCPGHFNPILDEVGETVDDGSDTGNPACGVDQVEVGNDCMGLSTVIGDGKTPTDLLLADLSGDGALDLVIADDGGEASFHLGSGGGFGGPVPILGSQAFGLAVGDIDGIPPLDLTTIGYEQVLLYGSMGGGMFPLLHMMPVGSGWDAAFGDIDDDGDIDLVVSDPGAAIPAIQVLTRDGGGYTLYTTLQAGAGPQGVALADVDGDDDLDLATADADGNQVHVFENVGGGDFNTAVLYSVSLVYDLAAADLDGDGESELLAVDGNDGNVAVLDVSVSFTIELLDVHAVGQAPRRIALGDVDGDGNVDAVTANNASGDASILLGDGTGNFATEIRLPALSQTMGALSVAVGDLDDDGRAEVVIGAYESGQVSLFVHVPSSA